MGGMTTFEGLATNKPGAGIGSQQTAALQEAGANANRPGSVGAAYHGIRDIFIDSSLAKEIDREKKPEDPSEPKETPKAAPSISTSQAPKNPNERGVIV